MRLHDVSVEFPIYRESSRSLQKVLLASTTQGNLARDARDRINVRALREVSLEMGNGDRFALIGPTVPARRPSKVLAGVYEPTTRTNSTRRPGVVVARTSVGLNIDATGRENIIMRGMYMDIHPREMRQRADEIAEFTELGRLLTCRCAPIPPE